MSDKNRQFSGMINTLIPFILFVCFFVVYFNSIDIHAKNYYGSDFIFDDDPKKVVITCSEPRVPARRYIHRHPLQCLLLKAPTRFLYGYIQDQRTSTQALISFIGAMSIPLAYVIFLTYLKKEIDALLFAALFGFCAPVWLFSSIASNYSLNLTMIVLAFYLQMYTLRFRSSLLLNAAYLIYSILSVGITLPNIVYSYP